MSSVKVYYPIIKHGGPSMKAVESIYEMLFDQANQLYVTLEDYEALKQSYINLNASYSAVKELDKHE